MTLIEDGTGGGDSMEVDELNRAHTVAFVKPRLYDISERIGRAFIFPIPLRTGTVNAGRKVYIKNTDQDRTLHIAYIRVNHNGGTTTHTLSGWVNVYVGDAAPTANHTTGTPMNLNRNSTHSALCDFYYWDEVGDGMTSVTGGSLIDSGIAGPGHSLEFKYDDALLLPYSRTLSVDFECEEIGEFTITVVGYFEEEDQ